MTQSNLAAQSRSPLSGRMLPLLLILFVGSGCAALIYEIVWLQLLQLVIGLTAASLGVLLGTFMGGMCLGSWLLPRFVSKSRHPLRVYAVLEIGIGIIGLIELVAVPIPFGEIYTAHVGHGAAGVALRAVLAGACLLPPTLLMGATLPAISRWVETSREGVSWLGFFYGGNIAGAVFGCLLAGFYLLRVHDMGHGDLCVAAAISRFVALVALVLAATMEYVPAKASAENEREDATPMTGTARAAYIAIALPPGPDGAGRRSGLDAAVGVDAPAPRFITFSIILAVFLIGLGIGSSLGALISRTVKRPAIALGVCQLLGRRGRRVVRDDDHAGHFQTGRWRSGSAGHEPVVHLPDGPGDGHVGDLARGVPVGRESFPHGSGGRSRGRTRDPGRLVGGVYAANTVSAIIGALCFSLIVIPTAGTVLGAAVADSGRHFVGFCSAHSRVVRFQRDE